MASCRWTKRWRRSCGRCRIKKRICPRTPERHAPHAGRCFSQPTTASAIAPPAERTSASSAVRRLNAHADNRRRQNDPQTWPFRSSGVLANQAFPKTKMRPLTLLKAPVSEGSQPSKTQQIHRRNEQHEAAASHSSLSVPSGKPYRPCTARRGANTVEQTRHSTLAAV